MAFRTSGGYSDFGFHVGRITPAVRMILIWTIALFVVQVIVDRAGNTFTLLFGLSSAIYRHGYVWQIFTYMFLHGHIWHLLLNMLMLFFLGPETERTIGTRHFLMLYFLSGILGGLGWLMLAQGGICIGASGAVLGVLAAFAALFPNRLITVLLFFVLPITIRAWVLVAVLVAIELLYVVSHFEDGIAHTAHVAGVAAGYIYALTVFRGFRIRLFSRRARAPRGWRVLRGDDVQSVPSSEIDRILDKIANEGMGSLTRKERAILERASLERRGKG